MGVLHHHHHHHSQNNIHHLYNIIRLSTTLTALIILLFAIAASASNLKTTQLGGQIGRDKGRAEWTSSAMERVVLNEKRLGGPGSSPPTCRSKCGRCSPCKPVHVPIQPRMSFPLDYYPEAWRCKCGSKLFMP